MPSAKKKPDKVSDTTAALRQQRRRDRLKELQARKVMAVLSKEQGSRLDKLLAIGYAPDQSAALAKGLDEAFERETKRQARTKSK